MLKVYKLAIQLELPCKNELQDANLVAAFKHLLSRVFNAYQ